MNNRRIPVAAPVIAGNEKAYVMDCLESTWISSTGKYIEAFETKFAEFCGSTEGVACSNGTTALHLALMALGVGPGDEVIVPTLTFVATANAVTYCGARPVLVDCEPHTWTIDPDALEARITPRTKGIIVVHLFGHPADMDPVLVVTRRHGLFVLEDAAQAHGAEYKGRRVGSMGHAATFSFFGNKIVTTGEGGMVVTSDSDLADRARRLRGHGQDPKRRYWFPTVGYNYRMTNVSAAIGLAQLERVEWQLERRRELARWYQELLRGVQSLEQQGEREWARHVWWMFSVVLGEASPVSRDEVISRLGARGIETRPVVYPMHQLPPYRDAWADQAFPIADRIAARGLNLPTWGGLSREDVEFVCESLLASIGEQTGRR